jgi:YVTN family beta-propeller protein
VSVINTATKVVTAIIKVDAAVPSGTSHLALTPDSRSVYVTGFNPVSVIDTGTDKVVATIPLRDGPSDIAIPPTVATPTSR